MVTEGALDRRTRREKKGLLRPWLCKTCTGIARWHDQELCIQMHPQIIRPQASHNNRSLVAADLENPNKATMLSNNRNQEFKPRLNWLCQGSEKAIPHMSFVLLQTLPSSGMLEQQVISLRLLPTQSVFPPTIWSPRMTAYPNTTRGRWEGMQ